MTVRREAMYALAEIARDKISGEGDPQTFFVTMTDNRDRPVYSAALSLKERWFKE